MTKETVDVELELDDKTIVQLSLAAHEHKMTLNDFILRVLDDKIKEMLNHNGPVIFDCQVDPNENCFPMIPSGKPHNQMILGPEEDEEISDEGKILV